jgi:hypothetical protein
MGKQLVLHVLRTTEAEEICKERRKSETNESIAVSQAL